MIYRDGSVIAQLEALRVVPVAVLNETSWAAPMGAALKEGGLPCVEVTLRTPNALEALAALAADTDLLVGAGTVTRPDHVRAAVDAGARFIVSPGFSRSVVDTCLELDVPVIPGVATATEIQMALEAGLTHVKFFPAKTSGGLAALSALSAPFGDVRFMPTGGITVDSLGSYLAHKSVAAVGGSWMVAASLLSAGDFARVTELAGQAVRIVSGSATARPSTADTEATK
ncbi:bifunctional 4-hydroxy-2-oxoglutarate aldolase/2-dehydro-3-deoxy-phosphogluconate aldolase [Nocardioides pyridinolyticus]